jgi:hypothetical protein
MYLRLFSNEGVTGAGGGVIFNPGGQKDHRYSWGVGHKINNQEKILDPFIGLTLIHEDKT